VTSKTTLAAIRFGYGLGPITAQLSGEALLAGLAGGNDIARAYPTKSVPQVTRMALAYRAAQKAADRKKNQRRDRKLPERQALREAAALGILHGTARILDTDSRFFERLSWFWADHFTAVGKNLSFRAAAPAYLDEAIRPNVTGRFADMLKAVISHPFMLAYLDQTESVGPNSATGKRRGRGLNENLARELLELHTLGVGADYDQGDVRQLAELLTGLSFAPRHGFRFNPRIAEPGSKTVLGRIYGGERTNLDDIYRFLDDLAARPETARHLSRKLAVHFVADDPEASMVSAMTAAYMASDGELMAVYRAMLAHPAAWDSRAQKAKQPFDFIVSALVAVGLSGAELLDIPIKDLRNLLARPLEAMGQPFMQARGPDGWPEAAENWITPQGLATRISWSVGLAGHVGNRVGDPRDFVKTTLADAAGERLTQAVARAETVADGVALVFASAEFNRR